MTQFPLLSLASRRSAWTEWFDKAGSTGLTPAVGASFEHFLMLAQAVVAGAGVALIPSFLIEPELASGALVRALAVTAESESAYYLVYPPDRLDRPVFAQFREWLIEAAVRERSA